jgi:hypothetical protein
VDKTTSSRVWYEELKGRMEGRVTVGYFNQVRFLSKIRQLEVQQEEDYDGCYVQMRRFNELGEQLFRKRVLEGAGAGRVF